MKQFTQRWAGGSWEEQSAPPDRGRRVADSVASDTARPEFGGPDFEALADPARPKSAPLFRDPLYVGRPNLGNRERLLARITDILDRRWFTNDGEYVQEFERRIADYLGVEHCVAMCNGTVAIEIAIRAAGLGQSSRSIVYVRRHSSCSSVAADTQSFCDWIWTPKRSTPTRRAADHDEQDWHMAVHLWGRPCDIDALRQTWPRGLRKGLIFDASQAFACSHQGQMIGSFGDAEVFSFHATKVFNTFEGGAIVTNDAGLADKARLMRNFGFADYDEVVSCWE